MLQRLIIALNSINTPLLAIVVMLLGCAYSVVCKDHSMNAESAAGIIGAGIGLLTGQALTRTRTDQVDGHPPSVQQSTGGDSIAKVLVVLLAVIALSGCAVKAKPVTPVAVTRFTIAPYIASTATDVPEPQCKAGSHKTGLLLQTDVGDGVPITAMAQSHGDSGRINSYTIAYPPVGLVVCEDDAPTLHPAPTTP